MGDHHVICIDMGSLYTRVGTCRDDAPRQVFVTEVDSSTGEVGYEEERKDGIKALQKGHAVDKGALEKIWDYSVNGMRRYIDEDFNPGILVNIKPDTTDSEKKHLGEYMFEKHNLEHVGMAQENQLTLYSNGRTCGFTMISGEGGTYFSSVDEGFYCAKPTLVDIPSGADLTELVRKSLRQQFWKLTTSQARLIKESISDNREEYELPNGKILKIGHLKQQIEHAFFTEGKLHEKLHSYIEQSDEFIRPTLYNNIVFGGGNTFFDCLEKEPLLKRMNTVKTNTLLCKTDCPKIIAPHERKNSIWIGGSIIGTLNLFRYSSACVSRELYDEQGLDRLYATDTLHGL